MSVAAQEVLELTVNEFATLCLCLELPQPIGLGQLPFAGLSAHQLTQMSRTCLESMAAKGYVEDLLGAKFRVREFPAQIIAVAAQASAVLRVLTTEAARPSGLAFVYVFERQAVVHEIRIDGTHCLVPKPVDVALDEVAQGLGGLPDEHPISAESVVLARAELSSAPSVDGSHESPLRQLMRRDLARMIGSVRVDLAWPLRESIIAPYLVMIASDERTMWLLTGIGDLPEDMVTCRPASVGHVQRAFRAMLAGSDFS